MTIDVAHLNLHSKHRNSFSDNQRISSSYYRCFQNYYHGHNYLNPNPKYIASIKSVVNHWQLRDLLQVNQRNGDIYFTKSYSLWKVEQFRDADKVVSHEVLNPDYTPKCFNITNDGIVVMGGLITSAYKIFYSNIDNLSLEYNKISRPQKGLFTFTNNNLNTSKTVKVGEMINNSVSVYPYQTNHYKSYICNNDSALYCVDVMNNDKMAINNKVICDHDTSLNNVVKSPYNEKLLIVTGDSPNIYLIDPSIKSSKIDTIKTDNDSGFGISYHPNGNLFSTAFQNGTCLIYDIRNIKTPVKLIQSTRPGHQSGAFRCCKFSNNAFSDLLVVLEHVGRVHLIDLRNLNDDNHQVIVFPFALDQFGEYKSGKLGNHQEIKDNQAEHDHLQIYDKSAMEFNAPLVYDYDYLTNINPKLFKYYSYHPPVDPDKPLNLENESLIDDLCVNSQFDNPYTVPESLSPTSHNTYHNINDTIGVTNSYSPDSYQQADNHIYGEMELSGLDWFDSKLLIGSEGGGILSWDVNHQARRSFELFSFV